ncbi:MAG: cobalamin-dependent protein [Candidatus Aegiribacteria sp.]|nr:cobalamin-dependent protein [Candidatus Aegiribacteria sp.]
MSVKAIDHIYEAIIEANISKADQYVNQMVLDTDYQGVLDNLLIPLLDRIGTGDETKWLNVAQGYVTSKILRRILSEYEEAVNVDDAAEHDVVVLCNAEDDCHPLGRMIVASILRGHGWGVVDLGIDVEPNSLLDAAERIGARVVGVSAMTYTTASNIHKVREEITSRGLTGKIKLAVGGVPFRLDSQLVAEVEADGTAANALHAPALFRRLWDQTVDEEGDNHER